MDWTTLGGIVGACVTGGAALVGVVAYVSRSAGEGKFVTQATCSSNHETMRQVIRAELAENTNLLIQRLNGTYVRSSQVDALFKVVENRLAHVEVALAERPCLLKSGLCVHEDKN